MNKIITLLFIGAGLFTQAQSISGVVYDADKAPIEFASVRILSVSDSTVIKGAYTTIDGAFEIEDLDLGSYLMKITYLNHDAYFQTIALDSKDNMELAPIYLVWDKTVELGEVTATGSLDILKAGIDKKVYSVEDDISVKGGSVNDVLNNIPSIEIDQDGKISLRGDGNVTILIDGRPSALISGNGQNMLDALPANSIERIEVVTNPSAKYDPDGTSGIINIVLKKNKVNGFNGLVSATAGTGNQYEGNFALSYRNNKFNYYLNYSLNYYEGYRNYSSELERDITNDSTTILSQQRDGTDLKSTNTAVIGFDYYINPRNTLGFSGTGSLGRRERTGDLINRLYGDSEQLIERWDRYSEDPGKHKTFDVNLNYTHNFKKQLGQWSLNANQSMREGIEKGVYEQRYFDEMENPKEIAFLNQQLNSTNKETISVLQTDYNYILKKIKARLEAGGKAILSDESISTNSETRDTLNGVYNQDTLANFDYKYHEEIYSIYGIFGQELGKFKYQIGLRGEYAEQIPVLLGSAESYENTYFNLFPSAHVKYVFSKISELSLSYSRRINRAESRQLNPFTSYADPLNLRTGNPALKPEYIDSYDLGYSFTKKKLIFSWSIFHRRTKDVINRVKYYYSNNTAVVTYANIDKSESTGLETIIIYKPFSWMKNTLSFNGNYINYTNLANDTDWNNDGLNWGIKYILSVDFWKKTASFQLNAAYAAPRVTPQGIVRRRTGIDLSMEKRFFNKRLSVGARVTDIFNTKGFELELVQSGVRQTSEYKWLTRRFLVTASYQFGNLDGKSKPGRSGGGGDEL